MGKQSSALMDIKTDAQGKSLDVHRCRQLHCKQLLISGIKAYQCLSRALLLRNCRFHPSCSQYAIDAVERFGIAGGLKKAVYRILRCSPVTDGGYDPVR
jgi:putative membrane protein insertion efficiency factor